MEPSGAVYGSGAVSEGRGPNTMDGSDEDSYVEYEVVEVEEILVDSGRYLCWKGGLEYHHVAWLRVVGRECAFAIYRDDREAMIVAVEQVDVCDECVERVRDFARARGCELVERRANWNAVDRPACSRGAATPRGRPTLRRKPDGGRASARPLDRKSESVARPDVNDRIRGTRARSSDLTRARRYQSPGHGTACAHAGASAMNRHEGRGCWEKR